MITHWTIERTTLHTLPDISLLSPCPQQTRQLALLRPETSSEHGSILRILLLIIILRARPTTTELQGGLCEVEHSKSGRKTDPYCGSVAIVRFLPLGLSLLLIGSLAVFQPGRARLFFGALFRDFL